LFIRDACAHMHCPSPTCQIHALSPNRWATPSSNDPPLCCLASVFMASDGSISNSAFAMTFTTILLISCEKLIGTANYSTWVVLSNCGSMFGRFNCLPFTRPDITFAVSVVSQFLNAPCNSHWDAIMHILRYIKNAPGCGLLYEDEGNAKIVGYCLVDWTGSPSDRRSTSGYFVLLGGKLISWRSKIQFC